MKDKKRDKRGRDGAPSGEGSLKKREVSKHSHYRVCVEPCKHRGQHNREEKLVNN